MSVTHGGNYRIFEWQLVGNTIYIENTRGSQHSYELTEILDIFTWLKATFGYGWFPLANNVKLMGRGQEKDGLGTAILDLTPKDFTHALGSSISELYWRRLESSSGMVKRRGSSGASSKHPRLSKS
jgi:hypothetical protein